MERILNPYIFLDIDGVLVTNKTPAYDESLWYNKIAYPFNKSCVNILNLVLEKTNAEIILSSDWRRMFELEEINRIFNFYNVIKSPVDKTSVLHDRDIEIRDYVTRKKLSKFVILDDSQLTGYKERLIKTNPEKGLQTEHIKRICKLLK